MEISETEDADWANKWKEFFKPFYIEDLLVAPSWLTGEEIASFIKYESATESPSSVACGDSLSRLPARSALDKRHWRLAPPGGSHLSVPIATDSNHSSPILRIDPGSAFGTGMHETTQLCIKAIKEYVKDDTMLLDVGTGSGILGIIALLYGAKGIVGTDLDICAIDAVAENLEQNGLSSEQFSLLIGNLITDGKLRDEALSIGSSIAADTARSANENVTDPDSSFEGFDIVTANILAEVLVNLTPVVPSMLKKGGIYITSGILEGKEQLVKKACEDAGMKVLSIGEQGEWRCVIAML
ncbi:MAG: 50S ribosomal protein L11 methyltransferase [Lachnospiraceae bacterium]|nr:50S ribosomal protein L11 methyltransferase [Lachnospiraceae bacterium]